MKYFPKYMRDLAKYIETGASFKGQSSAKVDTEEEKE
jgi:hypothetical protein